ncbi:histidyl-tRNA synthetase, class IIA [Asticcacaulis biprosthecium C19]|uniref:Histidyl-tRNA synthetase, class IIA n=1 Tax=Asticcacaulis biprosthecium C19 TaxID=715226 RepID=F4QLK1_9CAUL|nr:DUF6445 family protein [Asticcacaulis biprosthecium]EGF93499.1 histidyl-tRNA synthetase, class IIA [Asticcacaulis biprosthecium C19]
MDIQVHEIGVEKNRVVVIDDFLPDATRAVEAAAGLSPFPPETGTAYPGLRRVVTPAEIAADAYMVALLEQAAPFIGGVFDADAFDLLEASFSLVTRRREDLAVAQRVPHFDSPDPGLLAVLHYLNDIPGTGTCFYRHRATGIERVTADLIPQLHAAAVQELAQFGQPNPGFIGDSDERYEKILHVDGRFNRLLIYQGALLHSGFIPEDFTFSEDPRTGRLTGNLFVQVSGR